MIRNNTQLLLRGFMSLVAVLLVDWVLFLVFVTFIRFILEIQAIGS